MRNHKIQTRVKVQNAVDALDRKIGKCERELRKADPTSRAFMQHTQELSQLRQKRARLFSGVSYS